MMKANKEAPAAVAAPAAAAAPAPPPAPAPPAAAAPAASVAAPAEVGPSGAPAGARWQAVATPAAAAAASTAAAAASTAAAAASGADAFWLDASGPGGVPARCPEFDFNGFGWRLAQGGPDAGQIPGDVQCLACALRALVDEYQGGDEARRKLLAEQVG